MTSRTIDGVTVTLEVGRYQVDHFRLDHPRLGRLDRNRLGAAGGWTWTDALCDVRTLAARRGGTRNAGLFTRADVGTLTLELDNAAGDWTPDVVYGRAITGVRVGMPVRLTLNGRQVWTGTCDTLRLVDVPGSNVRTVALTFVDVVGVLGKQDLVVTSPTGTPAEYPGDRFARILALTPVSGVWSSTPGQSFNPALAMPEGELTGNAWQLLQSLAEQALYVLLPGVDGVLRATPPPSLGGRPSAIWSLSECPRPPAYLHLAAGQVAQTLDPPTAFNDGNLAAQIRLTVPATLAGAWEVFGNGQTAPASGHGLIVTAAYGLQWRMGGWPPQDLPGAGLAAYKGQTIDLAVIATVDQATPPNYSWQVLARPDASAAWAQVGYRYANSGPALPLVVGAEEHVNAPPGGAVDVYRFTIGHSVNATLFGWFEPHIAGHTGVTIVGLFGEHWTIPAGAVRVGAGAVTPYASLELVTDDELLTNDVVARGTDWTVEQFVRLQDLGSVASHGPHTYERNGLEFYYDADVTTWAGFALDIGASATFTRPDRVGLDPAALPASADCLARVDLFDAVVVDRTLPDGPEPVVMPGVVAGLEYRLSPTRCTATISVQSIPI